MRRFIAIVFQLCFRYAIRRIHVNQLGLKLNVTYQILVCADNILGGSVHTIQENAEALVFESKKTGLAVNSDKLCMYLAISRDQNA
jgi:hypothetical protein